MPLSSNGSRTTSETALDAAEAAEEPGEGPAPNAPWPAQPGRPGAAELTLVVEDPAVPAADRASMCVLDFVSPDCEAVKAIGRLADRLEGQFAYPG